MVQITYNKHSYSGYFIQSPVDDRIGLEIIIILWKYLKFFVGAFLLFDRDVFEGGDSSSPLVSISSSGKIGTDVTY